MEKGGEAIQETLFTCIGIKARALIAEASKKQASKEGNIRDVVEKGSVG